ncbi:hypothetical protein AAH161_19820, partial [Bacteroides ovatus]|uniref:hypothetical protein n=1 Tax=Bacteroides ovatus TaxID=28116 RepID=UPI0039B3D35C
RIKKEEEGNRRNKKEITTKFDEEPSYINAQSFLNNYEETVTRKYNLVDDSNPVLMNIYVK